MDFIWQKLGIEKKDLFTFLEHHYDVQAQEIEYLPLGAGLIGGHRDPADEHRLFFAGYGEANVSNRLLSSYR